MSRNKCPRNKDKRDRDIKDKGPRDTERGKKRMREEGTERAREKGASIHRAPQHSHSPSRGSDLHQAVGAATKPKGGRQKQHPKRQVDDGREKYVGSGTGEIHPQNGPCNRTGTKATVSHAEHTVLTDAGTYVPPPEE